MKNKDLGQTTSLKLVTLASSLLQRAQLKFASWPRKAIFPPLIMKTLLILLITDASTVSESPMNFGNLNKGRMFLEPMVLHTLETPSVGSFFHSSLSGQVAGEIHELPVRVNICIS